MSAHRDAAAALHDLHLTCVEPLIIAARKRRRLRACGIQHIDQLLRITPDLAATETTCDPACKVAIEAEQRYFAGYLGVQRSPVPAAMRGVPAIIDLALYRDFAAYQDRLRQHSKGGVLRQIRRAREQGFFCRTFYSGFYRRQVFAIEASKRFRSGSGLVLASLLRRPPVSDFPDGIGAAAIAAHLGHPPCEIAEGMPLPEPPPPSCRRHWRIAWGVFQSEGEAQERTERLVGYIFLKRTGNMLRTAGFMGHGEYLSHNVMKLLFYDVMRWLLARADPCVDGLRYLQYGAIEHGGDGLLLWKRGFEFAPRRFARPAPEVR